MKFEQRFLFFLSRIFRVFNSLIPLVFKTNYKHFKNVESSVRRRFSDFEWLKGELDKQVKVINFY